ncbi:hypothetical protein [Halorussus sp. MSC15.2]|uniref:hypothetical protein n=1 Tax=Halorussus sp. MSC15.2 TaxID=2283638 RepID=UPI0013D18210|nr:hypothetical protein [Halorussus sp. MSC15.2]NEU57568.1 hypothetical protein [Halorussus sp. MSC15.2]
MRRRRLLSSLSALGASLPIAGCVGAESPGTPTAGRTTETETTPPAPETTTASSDASADSETLALGGTFETPEGGTVTVHDVHVQRTAYTQFPHVSPIAYSSRQFVVVDATVSDHELFRQFSVAVDGRLLDGAASALTGPFSEPEGELFGVSVPAPLDAERAAVVWSAEKGTADEEYATARWPLSADHRRALANPPEFSVEGFEVPSEVERGSSFTAELTVANSGTGDETFSAELGATTISDTPEIRVEVPAGETVSTERTVEPHYPENYEELTVQLNWGIESIEQTVAVV